MKWLARIFGWEKRLAEADSQRRAAEDEACGAKLKWSVAQGKLNDLEKDRERERKRLIGELVAAEVKAARWDELCGRLEQGEVLVPGVEDWTEEDRTKLRGFLATDSGIRLARWMRANGAHLARLAVIGRPEGREYRAGFAVGFAAWEVEFEKLSRVAAESTSAEAEVGKADRPNLEERLSG